MDDNHSWLVRLLIRIFFVPNNTTGFNASDPEVEYSVPELANPPSAPTSEVQRPNIWTQDIYGKRVDPDSYWGKLRKKVFIRDAFTCVNCSSKINLTVDHIKPKSLGGTNTLDNLQTLCKDCHEDKHFSNFLDRRFDAIDDYGKNYEPTVKIRTLDSALQKKLGVPISYTDREGKQSLRVIHPHKIYRGYLYEGRIVYRKQVYVDAFCDLDQDNRTFRVSRMRLVRPPNNRYLV